MPNFVWLPHAVINFYARFTVYSHNKPNKNRQLTLIKMSKFDKCDYVYVEFRIYASIIQEVCRFFNPSHQPPKE